MRIETRTVRVGEWLGPIDWDYDFASHGWDNGGSMNPKCLADSVEMLRALEAGIANGEEWEATTDGGSPRCGWGRVTHVGMFDGWPYWKPVPSVLISGFLGGETASVFSLSAIRRARP